MRNRQHIADKKDTERHAAIAADIARVESQKRAADLEKQLEDAKEDVPVKDKDVADSVERSKAAMAAKFSTASNVRTHGVLAPNLMVATPTVASPAIESWPEDLSAKVAPTPIKKKERTRCWNNNQGSQ